MTLDSNTNNQNAIFFASSNIYLNITINSGATLNLNGFTIFQRGNTFTNNGILTGTITSSRLYFAGTLAQTFSGNGTILTNLDGISFGNSAGVTLTNNNQIITLRVNLFAGNITNSNKLTMGTGAALSVTTQIGSSAATTPGGSFDQSPIFNLGTGAYTVLYLEETAAENDRV